MFIYEQYHELILKFYLKIYQSMQSQQKLYNIEEPQLGFFYYFEVIVYSEIHFMDFKWVKAITSWYDFRT